MISTTAFTFFIFWLLCTYSAWLLVGLVMGMNIIPIWAHKFILRREVVLVKSGYDESPFKLVVYTDKFDGSKYGFRYHLTRIGRVAIYKDGTADHYGSARWIKT